MQQSNKISNNTHNCSSDFALASIDQPKGFLKFVTHMFAFNYIKAPVFNNYLIYISNKLDWFFFLYFQVQPCQSLSPPLLPGIKGKFPL